MFYFIIIKSIKTITKLEIPSSTTFFKSEQSQQCCVMSDYFQEYLKILLVSCKSANHWPSVPRLQYSSRPRSYQKLSTWKVLSYLQICFLDNPLTLVPCGSGYLDEDNAYHHCGKHPSQDSECSSSVVRITRTNLTCTQLPPIIVLYCD